LIDFLRNRSSAWIYTTALAPGSVAAAISAIEIVQVEADKRESLWKNVEYLGSLLRGSGISVIDGESPIFAVLVGNTERTLSVAKYLKEKGIFAPAIRPPTVPTSRIRITLNSSHTFEQIQMLVSCLGEAIADLDR
jgi:8-amino-7-oxononanoate synthase